MPLLPNEPRVVDTEKAHRLTMQYLEPGLTELAALFFSLRLQVDTLLRRLNPENNGKPYPAGQCLEISLAVADLLVRLDPKTLNSDAAAGYARLNAFLQNGGTLRQVWGDLRGRYFQNAFLAGTLYIDVANDTVVQTKPKIEILPFDISGLRPIRGYGHYTRIAEKYWGTRAWPNHVAPALAPFFPMLMVFENGKLSFKDSGAYMLFRTWAGKFRSSQRFLMRAPMPKAVFEQVAELLKDISTPIAEDPEQGRRLALQQVKRYRKERWHRRPSKQNQMIELGRIADLALAMGHNASFPDQKKRFKKNDRPTMKILFVHQNFPGQFKYLAPALAAKGHQVTAVTMQKTKVKEWQGVRLVSYLPDRGTASDVHPWVTDFETKIIRGEACFRAALTLKSQGYVPDAIVAHHGWGESLFLKEVWPMAKLGIYCEFYYRSHGADVGFDSEFPVRDPGNTCRLRIKNLNNLLHFDVADAGISPTYWQASTFPEPFRSRITVVHDGIDTDLVAPNPGAGLTLNGRLPLTGKDEVITFVNRNLEPYRGYHIFMRSLPTILKRRPNARILIVGGEDVSYGVKPQGAGSWKDIFSAEVRPRIPDEDWARVHFLGTIPYEYFIPLLQISTVHVYLTYPFVLSWSLLEAMSCGCAIVASDTQPLHEAVVHGETGRLVDFFDVPGLAEEVCSLLETPGERARLGANARQSAREKYDLKTVCLPRQMDWVYELANSMS